MSNISDKDIDKIFQQAADKYDIPFDDKGWEDMQRRLDNDDPDGGGGMAYFRMLGVIIGLFLLGGTYIWWHSSDTVLDVKEIAKIESIVSKEGLKGEETVEKHQSSPTEQAFLPGEDERQSIENEASLLNKSNFDKQETSGTKIQGNVDDYSDNPVRVTKNSRQEIDNSGAGEAKKTQQRFSRSHPAEAVKLSADEQSKTQKVEPVEDKDIFLITENDNLSGTEAHNEIDKKEKETDKEIYRDHSSTRKGVFSPYLPHLIVRLDYLPWLDQPGKFIIESVSVPEEEITDNERAKTGGFSIKLAYSPDFSSIGYFKPDKPGSNFGLIGEYYIGSRVSLSTGAIYSRKIYFSEETSAYGYSSRSESRVDGDCRVIDIPVNISYYFQQAARHNLYLTVGSSSYIMLQENYNYSTNYGQNQWSEEFKNENSHLFSILNLSVGYEARIGNRLYLQLEPFLKAPMKGVGEGKIDLVSTGAFLNMRYQITTN